MVPNLTKGRGIKGTALYVLHDERTPEERALRPDQQTADRIGMTATRNLSTDDPDLAWRLMCATAKNRDALKAAAGVHKGGKQAKYEVGHLSLSWDHEQRPDRAEMLKAAEGALTALGWQKAQALIVEHRDHDHSHCHIVVNLVDPETGKALPNVKDDRKVLQAWAHEYDAAAGNIVCKDRAAKYEREKQAKADREQRPADQPAPQKEATPKQKKWLPRDEWEAQRRAANDTGTAPRKDRAAQQAERVGRYRDAADAVREQMRPEWSQHYKNQRQQERMLERAQRATMRDLDRAAQYRRQPQTDFEKSAAKGIGTATKTGLVDFYNANTALIWEGIPANQRPQSVAAIINKPALKRAVEAAHEKQRADLAAAHEAAKKELQARHEAARVAAQRAAWKQPEQPATDPTARAEQAQRAADNRTQAERDFDASAERIRRHRKPANESRAHEKDAADRQQQKRARDATDKPSDPRRDDLAAARARADAEAAKLAAIRTARQARFRGRGGPEREPGLD